MLNLDSFFYTALRNSDVHEDVGGRIFNPARDEQAEKDDALPYIVINTVSETAGDTTKDDCWAELTRAQIDMLVVAKDREALADLTLRTYDVLREAVTEDSPFYVIPSASLVQLDPFKPCCFQTLSFVCDAY